MTQGDSGERLTGIPGDFPPREKSGSSWLGPGGERRRMVQVGGEVAGRKDEARKGSATGENDRDNDYDNDEDVVIMQVRTRGPAVWSPALRPHFPLRLLPPRAAGEPVWVVRNRERKTDRPLPPRAAGESVWMAMEANRIHRTIQTHSPVRQAHRGLPCLPYGLLTSQTLSPARRARGGRESRERLGRFLSEERPFRRGVAESPAGSVSQRDASGTALPRNGRIRRRDAPEGTCSDATVLTDSARVRRYANTPSAVGASCHDEVPASPELANGWQTDTTD